MTSNQMHTDDRRHRRRRFPFEIILSILLTLITLILQSIALFTTHWKEISTASTSLYVDGIDALIRTEVLHYFDSIHRATHLNYGLFDRCQSMTTHNHSSNYKYFQPDNDVNHRQCTRNVLPFYPDEKFDECHSLNFYRTCVMGIARNDNTQVHSSCECRSPSYIVVARWFGIFAWISLFLFILIHIPLVFITSDKRIRKKFILIGFILCILTTLSIMIELVLIMKNFRLETIDYLTGIEQHYKTNQIYKLSKDARIAIDRFLSNIKIEVGYSTLFGFSSLVSSIIHGFFFIFVAQKKTDNVKRIDQDYKQSKSIVDQNQFLALQDDEV